MKPRSCIVRVWIANDAGKESCYSVRPLPAAALGGAAAGFRVCNLSADPMPVYAVCVYPDGLTSCDCPAHQHAKACKHADALAAAGVLPCALIGVLQSRTKLLDDAEREIKSLRKNVDDLAATVQNLATRCASLQNAVAAIPPRSPRKRKPAPVTEAA